MRAGALILLLMLAASTGVGRSVLYHNNGNLVMGVSDFGAFAGLSGGMIASTFVYPRTDPAAKPYLGLVSELWAGISPDLVASAVDLDEERGEIVLGEWEPTPSGAVSLGEVSGGRMEISAQYGVKKGRLNLLIDQLSYSWNPSLHPRWGDFVLVKLTITNLNPAGVDDLYLAVAANWDVDASDPASGNPNLDMVGWDDRLKLSYFYDADEKDGLEPRFFGVAIIRGKVHGHRVVPMEIWSYRDADRYALMSESAFEIGVKGTDFMSVISLGPYDLVTRAPKTVIFAFVAGNSLEELKRNAMEAMMAAKLPARVEAGYRDGLVELSWLPPIDPSVSGYTIYRREEGSEEFKLVSPWAIKRTSFRDAGVEPGRRYLYVIRPVTMEGELGFSTDEIEVTAVERPGRVEGLRAEPIPGGIRLTWKEVSGASGYTIFRRAEGESWRPIAEVEAWRTDFTDRTVLPGRLYTYAVSAERRGIKGELSEPAAIAPPENRSVADISSAFPAPNPCSISGDGSVGFRNLPNPSSLRIYSLNGMLVRELFNYEGGSEIRWDLKDSKGRTVPPGLYIYRLEMYLEKGERRGVSGTIAVLP